MSDLMKVGPDWGTLGTFKPFTSGASGAQRVLDAHGRYYDSASLKRMFFAATPSGQTTTVGLATTYVGLVLSNPVGNSFNLALSKVGWAQSVINAAVNAVGLAVGYNQATNVTHTTPVTAAHCTFFQASGQTTAKVDTAATLPTAPVYFMFLQSTPTATTNPSGGWIDLEHSLIIPPGGYVMTATVAASPAAAFWASMSWEEIPILT